MNRPARFPIRARTVVLSSAVGFMLLVTVPAPAWQARPVGALTDGPAAPTSLAVAEDGIAALQPYSSRIVLFTPDGVLTASAPNWRRRTNISSHRWRGTRK